MNNSFLEKWLTCIDNQFTDNSEYATYNDIFVSSQKNHNYYLNKLINYIINNNIIDKDSDITLLINTLVLLKKLQIKYIFSIITIYWTLFILFRIVFYFIYRDIAGDIIFSELLKSFFMGIRFDFRLAIIISFPLIILAIQPLINSTKFTIRSE